jgi:hypothetical protein
LVQNSIEAESIKAVLESYGIPVMLRSPTVTHTMFRGINAGPISDLSLVAPGERAEEAANLLQALEEGSPEESEDE